METKANPFIGAWETSVDTSSMLSKKMIFTANEVTCYDEEGNIKSQPAPGFPEKTMTWKGPYTYTDTKLTIHHAPPSAINLEYEFKNSILYLVKCPYNKL